MFLSKVTHEIIIGSGSQPTTMCAEYKAAEVKRMMAKPCQAVEGKTLLQNPVFATAIDFETGRAPVYMYKPGDEIPMTREE